MTMREPTQPASATKTLMLFLLLFVAIAAMAYWFNTRSVPEAQVDAAPEEQTETVVAAVSEVAPASDEVPVAEAQADPVIEPEVEPVAEPEVEREVEPDVEVAEAFGFDVVRVEPNGSSLVAGFAPAGKDVLLMVDGVELARGTADLSGKFVVLFDMPGADEPRNMSIGIENDQGELELAKSSVLIAPIRGSVEEPASDLVAEAEPELQEPAEEVDVAAAEPEAADGNEEVAELLAEVESAIKEEVAAETSTDTPQPDVETEIAQADISAPEVNEPEISASDIVAQSSIDPLTPVAPEQPSQPDIALALANPQSVQPSGTSEPLTTLAPNESEAEPLIVATAPPAPSADGDASAGEDVTVEDDAATSEVASDASEETENSQVATAQVDAPQEQADPPAEVADEIGSDPVIAQTADRARATVPQNTQTAPAVVLLNEQGVTVLQPAPLPQAPGPEVVYNVVIDTISYDSGGNVNLTGRGAPAAFVRIYLNDRLLKELEISADGGWETPLDDIDAGVYRLRIDEVDAGGIVTSRIETPFQREQVSLAAGASGAITVQPGFTLWAIAEANFGDGAQFVRVYEANRDLIRDPDLIYPGQVFEIPKDIE